MDLQVEEGVKITIESIWFTSFHLIYNHLHNKTNNRLYTIKSY